MTTISQTFSYTLSELAQTLGAEIQGDPNYRVSHLKPLTEAFTTDLTFYNDPRYKSLLSSCQAGAIVITAEDAKLCHPHTNKLVMSNPHAGFARLAHLFQQKILPPEGIHPSAVVDSTAELASHVSIGPHVVIGPHAKIGAHTIIEAGSVVQHDVIIGSHCHLYPQVTVCHHCLIADRVILHPGVVIGSDGFGNARDGNQWVKVPQLGRAMIGCNVEIGANTVIDRGALGDTVIEEGARLDNLIQVAHNVHIGAHTAIAGCVGIAGSAKIGRYCMIGGAVSINGHITIADHVILTGSTVVHKSISEPGIYSSGLGVQENRAWRRSHARFMQLDEMAKRIQQLEKKLNDLTRHQSD